MEEILTAGLGAAAAWMVALLPLRFRRSALLFHVLIVGGICAAAESVIFFTGSAKLAMPVFIGIFLLMTFAVGLERPDSHGDALLALLTAGGAFGIFLFVGGCGKAGVWLACVAELLFAFLAWRMRGIFPEQGWREYFAGTAAQDKKLNVRVWQIYVISALQCVFCCACAMLPHPGTTAETVLLLSALCLIYWGALLVIPLMIEYRRESMAALIEQQYRGEMQSYLNVIRSQRHDYNFHVQTLAQLFRTGNTDACRKYVDELVEDSVEMNTLLPIRDPAIGAMINNFRILAARSGTELFMDIQNDLSQVVTNVYETNKIISNLLQNALDETSQHTDRSYGIHLTILKRGEFCVIHVTNAFRGEVNAGEYIHDIYRQGYTTKPGHDGVGLSSVKLLLSRYNGVIYTRIEDGTIRFTVKIPLRYSVSEEDRMGREEDQ